MKETIWLSRSKDRNHWHYGLARHKDGSIQVSEILFSDGFAPVGTSDSKGTRLYKGERKLILMDLYDAISKELGFPISTQTMSKMNKIHKQILHN